MGIISMMYKKEARAKILKNKGKVRAQVKLIPPGDLNTIIKAIQEERDIAPFLPAVWINELKNPNSQFGRFFLNYADAEFFLELIPEILPEYDSLFRSRKPWLAHQMAKIKVLAIQ